MFQHQAVVAIAVLLSALLHAGTAMAQKTYWIPTVKKEGNQRTLAYNVRVPDYFVPWLLHTSERGGGKESTKAIQGKTYTFVKQYFTWDNTPGGANPTATGQIRIDTKLDRDASDLWELSDQLKGDKEFIAAMEALASGDKQHWRRLDLVALVTSSRAVPTFEEAMDPLTNHQANLAELAERTKAGEYFADAKVPAMLVPFRVQMLAIGNLARRDPNYRKDHRCEFALDLSRETTRTDRGMEKVFKHNDSPPFFKDLVLNQKLSKAAQFHAEYMASIQKVTHDGPADYMGHEMRGYDQRLAFFEYSFPTEGEGAGAGGPSEFPTSWMSSDSHFRPWFNVGMDVKEVGLGVAQGADGTWYFCAIGGEGRKE